MSNHFKKVKNWLKQLFHQPPSELAEAKRVVDSRLQYVFYKSRVRRVGNTVVSIEERRPAGLRPNQGNCVAYAKAYRAELGGRGKYVIYKLPDGTDHIALAVDGWVLDNRERWVVKQGKNCK